MIRPARRSRACCHHRCSCTQARVKAMGAHAGFPSPPCSVPAGPAFGPENNCESIALFCTRSIFISKAAFSSCVTSAHLPPLVLMSGSVTCIARLGRMLQPCNSLTSRAACCSAAWPAPDGMVGLRGRFKSQKGWALSKQCGGHDWNAGDSIKVVSYNHRYLFSAMFRAGNFDGLESRGPSCAVHARLGGCSSPFVPCRAHSSKGA